MASEIKNNVSATITEQANHLTEALKKQCNDELAAKQQECGKRLAEKDVECNVIKNTEETLDDSNWKRRMDDAIAHCNSDWKAKSDSLQNQLQSREKDLQNEIDSLKMEMERRVQEYAKRIADMTQEQDNKLRGCQHDREISEQKIRAACKQF